MNDSLKRHNIAVVGLGKLGAPMAAIFGAKGHNVIGLDNRPEVVSLINSGLAPVEEPQLQAYLNKAKNNLRATADYQDAIINSDISFIIVPTPSGPDRFFENKFVLESVKSIARVLRNSSNYHVIVITSTVMPGSTGGVIRETLEKESGRIVGKDVGLCYSPEFIALGSVVHDMLFPDMVLIGESDPRAGDTLESVYLNIVESNPSVHRMNFVNAELSKISVNTFVTTKISYANMIADMCDKLPGANAQIVTQAIGADSRIGSKYLKPAIGYGGPCFPRDNKAFVALGHKLDVNSALAEATDNINDYQIKRIIAAVTAVSSAGSQILLLGLSYKPNTNVIEESQSVLVAKHLTQIGYKVTAFDPQANENAASLIKDGVVITEDMVTAVSAADVIIIMTPWSIFKNLKWSKKLLDEKKSIVIDPWGIIEKNDQISLIRLGSLKSSQD